MNSHTCSPFRRPLVVHSGPMRDLIHFGIDCLIVVDYVVL